MSINLSAVPQLKMLAQGQCEAIHEASLKILQRTGVQVFHAEAVRLLREAGVPVDDDNVARIPRALVEWALEGAPHEVTLYRRGTAEPAVRLAPGHVNFGTGSDCLHYLDPRTGLARDFTAADVAACMRLCDALPEINFAMSCGIPSDLGSDNVYRQQFAIMLRNTVKPLVFVADTAADCEVIAGLAAAAAGGDSALEQHPTLLLYSEPTTPLRHSETATGKLLFMAEHALPVVHSPAPMMGGTAPVTLAGGLALGNAEALSSLVIHQLQRRGAPFVYGSGLHHLDMLTTISVYGAPEFQLARVAVAEMGRFYALPTWGYAGQSDSNVMDEQAASDATFSVLIALLSGTNLVHDVGYLEAGLTTAPEMIVFTDEMIAMMRRFVGGFSLDAEALALDVIDAVGPGGDYLATDHTLEHFREFWQPTLFDRRRADEWREAGAQRLGKRLREKTLALMEEHEVEPLSPAAEEAILRLAAQPMPD